MTDAPPQSRCGDRWVSSAPFLLLLLRLSFVAAFVPTLVTFLVGMLQENKVTPRQIKTSLLYFTFVFVHFPKICGLICRKPSRMDISGVPMITPFASNHRFCRCQEKLLLSRAVSMTNSTILPVILDNIILNLHKTICCSFSFTCQGSNGAAIPVAARRV